MSRATIKKVEALPGTPGTGRNKRNLSRPSKPSYSRRAQEKQGGELAVTQKRVEIKKGICYFQITPGDRRKFKMQISNCKFELVPFHPLCQRGPRGFSRQNRFFIFHFAF